MEGYRSNRDPKALLRASNAPLQSWLDGVPLLPLNSDGLLLLLLSPGKLPLPLSPLAWLILLALPLLLLCSVRSSGSEGGGCGEDGS